VRCDIGSATSLPAEKAGWGFRANRNCPAGRLPSDTGVQGQLGAIGSTRLPQNEGPLFSPLSFPRFLFFFLKLDSAVHLTVILFVSQALVLAKAFLLF